MDVEKFDREVFSVMNKAQHAVQYSFGSCSEEIPGDKFVVVLLLSESTCRLVESMTFTVLMDFYVVSAGAVGSMYFEVKKTSCEF
jgi:hypothetical protein